jgi:hypothetical protein
MGTAAVGASDIELITTIANGLTVPLVLLVAIVALARGLFVTRGHHEAVIREKDAQIAQLERLYAIATDYAQKRGDLLHQEKAEVHKQLDANTQQMFKFADVLGELRDAVRDLTKARQG